MSMFYRYDALSELLAVKAPLLMLDQLQVDPDAMTVEGLKMVSFNENIFNGHFPDYPVLPG
ncbi:MAG: 3-hydroxyacyl-[acyl-carrier-protein] dehydratase FabZ, partial [Lentisphaeria bacterium]|nr:3-hydroxyacyl-[acyl-carrier-protein] dehydratase FabZ [Lentisphaeria bacterium]